MANNLWDEVDYDKYQVLKNLYQALKPGGKAYLQFFVLHGRPKNDRFIY